MRSSILTSTPNLSRHGQAISPSLTILTNLTDGNSAIKRTSHHQHLRAVQSALVRKASGASTAGHSLQTNVVVVHRMRQMVMVMAMARDEIGTHAIEDINHQAITVMDQETTVIIPDRGTEIIIDILAHPQKHMCADLRHCLQSRICPLVHLQHVTIPTENNTIKHPHPSETMREAHLLAFLQPTTTGTGLLTEVVQATHAAQTPAVDRVSPIRHDIHMSAVALANTMTPSDTTTAHRLATPAAEVLHETTTNQPCVTTIGLLLHRRREETLAITKMVRRGITTTRRHLRRPLEAAWRSRHRRRRRRTIGDAAAVLGVVIGIGRSVIENMTMNGEGTTVAN